MHAELTVELMFLPRTAILAQLEFSCSAVTQEEERGKKRWAFGGAVSIPDIHPPAVMRCWLAAGHTAGTKALLPSRAELDVTFYCKQKIHWFWEVSRFVGDV